MRSLSPTTIRQRDDGAFEFNLSDESESDHFGLPKEFQEILVKKPQSKSISQSLTNLF